MFLGEFTHTIDDKSRLTVPAKFRSDLAVGLVITRGFEENLMLFTTQSWQALAEKISGLMLTDSRIRDFRRRIFAGATDLTPDRQGRILIPPYLREFAQIGEEVTLIGMFDYIEMWNPQQWERERHKIEHPDEQKYWENLGF